jgi:hypothetical protein
MICVIKENAKAIRNSFTFLPLLRPFCFVDQGRSLFPFVIFLGSILLWFLIRLIVASFSFWEHVPPGLLPQEEASQPQYSYLSELWIC